MHSCRESSPPSPDIPLIYVSYVNHPHSFNISFTVKSLIKFPWCLFSYLPTAVWRSCSFSTILYDFDGLLHSVALRVLQRVLFSCPRSMKLYFGTWFSSLEQYLCFLCIGLAACTRYCVDTEFFFSFEFLGFGNLV